MTRPTLHSFAELQQAVDRMFMYGLLGLEDHISCYVDEFLADDPHVIMLLTWMEM